MQIHARTALLSAILAVGFAGAAIAQSTTPAPTTPGGSTGPGSTAGADKSAGSGAAGAPRSADAKLAAGEHRFMEDAARHGLAEVQLGKLAQDKAQDAPVKDFAKRMVDDHGKAHDRLKRLATAKGVTLPAEPDTAHKRVADRLGKLSGAEFDRAYMKAMVDDHEKDVKAFRRMAKSAKDADVKSFASSTLPVLEEHRKLAKSTYDATRKTVASASSKAGTSGPSASATGPGASAGATTTTPSGTTSSTAKGK